METFEQKNQFVDWCNIKFTHITVNLVRLLAGSYQIQIELNQKIIDLVKQYILFDLQGFMRINSLVGCVI